MTKQTKITKSARGEDCAIRLPGCRYAPENETTVLAHAPCVDKGMGIKSPDWWSAYAGGFCHDVVDGRQEHPYLERSAVQCFWLGAIYETQKKLIKKGFIEIC